MSSPKASPSRNHKVSVIIPAYNQERYLGAAIQSVLDQTYEDWQLIVVDDGSTDATARVVSQFDDARIRYLYQSNKGLPGARNTGIAHAKGEYLAFLDSDDLYHADKLATQVAHLNQMPQIGLSYSSRIEIDQEGNKLWLTRAPREAYLKELVMGFPFTINDLMIRRRWVERVGGFDESFLLNSEDRNFYLRLALAGCQFAGVDQVLAYRRLYKGRIFKNLAAKLETMLRALDTAFLDPRCPADVLALRDMAYGQDHLGWAYQEFVQGETALAQKDLRQAVQLLPSLLDDNGAQLRRFLVHASIRDGGEHEDRLRSLFAQLPPEMALQREHCEWAVARGYLLRGVRDVMWGRDAAAEGHLHFTRAAELGAQLDERFLRKLTDQLLNYEMEFGNGQEVLQKLTSYLKAVGSAQEVRWLHGCYALNRAFKDYHAGQYSQVPSNTLRAIFRDPTYLANRGVIAILIRSMVGVMKNNVLTYGA